VGFYHEFQLPFGESFSLIFPILGTNYALSMGSCPIHKDENWHDIIPEEYDVPGLASLDSPPTSRRGGSISISIPEIAFSSIFSETWEFFLYLQECYLGRRISFSFRTWIYSFCVPHLPMFKHPPIPQWKEMLLRDQRKLVPRQKDLVRRVEAIPQDIGFKLLRVTFCLTTRHGNWSSALSFLNGTAKA